MISSLTRNATMKDLTVSRKMAALQSLCVIMLTAVLIVSCANEHSSPPLYFEEDYVNQQISLTAPAYFNTFKTTDSVGLELRSHSENQIVFPNNYNLRVFRHTSGGWLEIKEKPTERFPSGDIILSPSRSKMMEVVTFFPDLRNPQEIYNLRIYVIGEMKTEQGIREVIAYVEITLNP